MTPEEKRAAASGDFLSRIRVFIGRLGYPLLVLVAIPAVLVLIPFSFVVGWTTGNTDQEDQYDY